MLPLKSNPVGKDWYIQELQIRLHTELVSAWGIDESLYACYGRSYRNRLSNGFVAEVYTGGNEYKEVYYDDQLAAISFFGQSGSEKKGLKSEVDIHLVFFVNLQKLVLKDKSGTLIIHRADEEVRQSVYNVVGRYSNGFSLISTELWIENVLREYDGTIRDKMGNVDMHPVHCFRLNLKLSFDPNKIC